MDVYRTEEEQVEAIKRWWEQNGRTAVMAVILVLAVIFGWKSWQQHERNQAEFASVAYELMQSDPSQADERGRALLGSYPDSGYATLAALSLARTALEAGRVEEAAGHLRWALEKGANPGLQLLARQRLARVQLDMGEAEQALSTLDGAAEIAGFEALFAETRGDILLNMGRKEEARDAYSRALEGYAELPAKLALVEMKLDDLTGVEAR